LIIIYLKEILVMQKRLVATFLIFIISFGLLTSCSGIVNANKIEQIVLDKTEITINVSESATITASVVPTEATGDKIMWQTSDSSIAVVSDGIVEGISEGTAVITAFSKNNVFANCIVNVKNSMSDDSNDNEQFDYLSSNLSEYIQFTKDYKNFTVDIEYASMKDMDVDVALLQMQCDAKGEALYDGVDIVTEGVITPGAVTSIWYRGYLRDEYGNKVDFPGMCNFADEKASSLEIGSGSFIPGFELGLVGKNFGDYSKFTKITTGQLKENQVAYVTYTYNQDGKDVTERCVRVDMSSKVDEKFGIGFRQALLGMEIGTYNNKITAIKDGKELDYTKLRVDFVTECESNPIVVETYFPYDYYTEELRNVTAYFEVYVDSVVFYEYPEINQDFVYNYIDENTNLTRDQFNEYKGDTAAEKLRSYVEESIKKYSEKEYNSLAYQAIFNYYLDIACIINYPQNKVDEFYNEYYATIEEQFIKDGGVIYNWYGGYTVYDTLDEYAIAYLGLKSNSNWKEFLVNLAKDAVRERLIVYSILRNENLIPEEDEMQDLVNEKKQQVINEYIDDYVEQYLDSIGKTKQDFTEDEYNQLVEEKENELLNYYGEKHFFEQVCYDLLMTNSKKWVTIKTLEDK